MRNMSWRLALSVFCIGVLLIGFGLWDWLRPRGSDAIPSDSNQAITARVKPAPVAPAPAAPVVPAKIVAPPSSPPTTAVVPKEEASVSPIWPADTVMKERIEKFKIANSGQRNMLNALEQLAARGDDLSIAMLFAMADDPEVGAAALDALGNVRKAAMRERVAGEIRKRLSSKDSVEVCAAAVSYIKLRKDEAIPEVVTLIRQNWARTDGRGGEICASAVRGLGMLGTSAANQALVGELTHVNDRDWLPDYGSVVVSALGRRSSLPDGTGTAAGKQPPLSPAVIAALQVYADALTRKMPGSDNPPGQKYYEEKIAEARAAIGAQAPTPPANVRGNGPSGPPIPGM